MTMSPQSHSMASSVLRRALIVSLLAIASAQPAPTSPAQSPSQSPSPRPPLPGAGPVESSTPTGPMMVDYRTAAQCLVRYVRNGDTVDYVSCLYPSAGFQNLSDAEKSGVDADGEPGAVCSRYKDDGLRSYSRTKWARCCFQKSNIDKWGRGVKLVSVPDQLCGQYAFLTTLDTFDDACEKYQGHCSEQLQGAGTLPPGSCERTFWGVESCTLNTCYCNESEPHCPCGDTRDDSGAIIGAYCVSPPTPSLTECCNEWLISIQQCAWRRLFMKC